MAVHRVTPDNPAADAGGRVLLYLHGGAYVFGGGDMGALPNKLPGFQDVTDDVAEAIGLEMAEGALVTDVPEGPAADAGMEAGDVILSFDGQDVADTRELLRRVGNTEVGKAVRIVIFRDGATQTLRVTLGRREEAETAVPASAPAMSGARS